MVKMRAKSDMRAIGYIKNLPVDDPECFVEREIPVPAPAPHDLLVRVAAVSVNPVDVKRRLGSDPLGTFKVLGFDAAGVVEAVGSSVTRFRIGDEVYYAGNVQRQGSDADYQVVDERIVGHKPGSLSFAEAAAMPLTTITAWEILFDHLGLTEQSTGVLVVLAAAGGVGSMVTQLARLRTQLTIIGTASRPESQRWVTDHGGHFVVNHHEGLAETVLALAPKGVDYVVSSYSKGNVDHFAEMLRPRGHIVAIDDEPENILTLKMKSLSWHWELMFTRPIFEPEDEYQHALLEQTAELVDAGSLRTTLTTTLGPLNVDTLREAHRLIETSATIGKIVITL